MQLIERRLLLPNYTLKQIVEEFGLTDESHLSNYFKSITGYSPTDYKRKFAGKSLWEDRGEIT